VGPWLIVGCYLIGALALTGRLWIDPAGREQVGNPGDVDLGVWFLRYAATAVAHGQLPALFTTAMNAPVGVNLMWNTSFLLPGVLLAPLTLLAGPQVSLTVALGGAVYGSSPALVTSGIGHYHLQFAVLPPLIIDAALRLITGRGHGVRVGVWPPRWWRSWSSTGTRCGVQFKGPLAEHSKLRLSLGSNLSWFVTPSADLLFHTRASAATAVATLQLPAEYLDYLGWPLIIVLVIAAVVFWRDVRVRTAAVLWAVLELCAPCCRWCRCPTRQPRSRSPRPAGAPPSLGCNSQRTRRFSSCRSHPAASLKYCGGRRIPISRAR
jgi:hypothetical protein